MIFCSKCGGEHSRQGQRYCVSCHNAYMREWRKTHPLNAEQRFKDTARSYANTYKKRGLIEREPCASCKSDESQMHHPDYAYPAAVMWLCRPCHMQEHQ